MSLQAIDDTVSPWLTRQNQLDPNDPTGQLEATATSATTPTTSPNPWIDPSTGSPQTAPPMGYDPARGTAAGTGDYTQDLGPSASKMPAATAPTASGGQMSAAQPVDYQQLMTNVNTATDPAQQSVARDALARQLQQDLQADGHTVTWKGDQLIVDGRPYEMGTGSATTTTDGQQFMVPGPDGTMIPNPNLGPIGPATHAPASYNSPPPDAAVADMVDEYIQSNGLQADQSDPRSLSSITTFLRSKGINAQVDYADANGHVGGILIDGHPYQLIDGSNRWTRLQPWSEGSSAGTGQSSITTSPYANGTGQMPDWLTNPQSDEDLTNLAGTIPGFSDIYDKLSATSPEEQQTSGLVQDILAHPESLTDRDVEELKAKNAEEAAVAAQAQDEDLQHFGAGAGLDTSPWLAAQRADTAWNRRSATIASNRTIDLSAAQTRQADRLASAALGQAFSGYKSARVQQAIATAVETEGVKGNLLQAAKALGMSKSQLLLSYVGQQLNYDIDLQALKQKGEQFVADLAQRIAIMKQNDDQFQANFGLALKQFQETKDQNAWLRAHQTFTDS